MPLTDQGTYFTYPNGNTRIFDDVSRSACASFRANEVNDDNIIFSIGSFDTTCDEGKGCNTHFALGIKNATHINVFGMCHQYDNKNILIGQKSFYDGTFHRICVTYNSTESKICLYLDSPTSKCFVRSNPPYKTALGDVRIGWWSDNNRGFVASGGGLIHSVSLFDNVLPQACIAEQFMDEP